MCIYIYIYIHTLHTAYYDCIQSAVLAEAGPAPLRSARRRPWSRKGAAEARSLRSSPPRIGPTYYTPEITKVKVNLKIPLTIPWTILVKIHWQSDNPLEHTIDK